MDRTQKKNSVETFAAEMGESESIVAALYPGVTVSQANDFRNKARKEGVKVKVMKNTLARLALKGTKLEGVTSFLKGQTILIYSKDTIASARIAHNFSKENEKLVITGGALPGETLDAARVKALANLPSLDALRSQILGLLQAPATKIAGVLQAPAGQLARVVNAYAQKGQ